MDSTVALIKVVILAALSYPGLAKLWRNLRQSRHPTTDADRRLVALWRWQAFGLLLAGVPIAVVWLLMSFPSRFDVPFLDGIRRRDHGRGGSPGVRAREVA